MRGLAAALLCLCSVSLHAADFKDVLLANRAALVSADTPPEVIEYLCDDQHALLLVVGGLANSAWLDSVPMTVVLPPLPRDSVAAIDSLRAWQSRYGAGVALLPRDKKSAEHWTAALLGPCNLFVRTSEFAAGDIAVPTKDGYWIFRGLTNRFFSDESTRFGQSDPETDGTDRTWISFRERAATAAASFESESPSQQLDALANLIRAADSLAATGNPQSDIARAYSWRWRHLLGSRLALGCDSPVIEAFSGIPATHTFTFHSANYVEFQIDSIRFTDTSIGIKWDSPLPQPVLPATPLTITGSLTVNSTEPLIFLWCLYSYTGVDLHSYIEMRIQVTPAIVAEFDPPILFADDEFTRTDPDYLIRVATGNVTLANRTHEAANLQLSWSADAALTITSPEKRVQLPAGKSERVTYTLSLPRELERKQYAFSLSVADRSGVKTAASGQLWASRPRFKDEPRVAVIGDAGVWLRAMRAIGITGYPLAAENIADADLHEFTAVVISHGALTPDERTAAVVRKVAEGGKLVIVSLSEASAAWLPWATPCETRPGPAQTKFHKPDIGWWYSPNTLVGDCFASPDSQLVYTLPAGTPDWEPLVVSQSGKGFMYRRSTGKGWFVVIHDGWARALERYDRRALLGLANLVGR